MAVTLNHVVQQTGKRGFVPLRKESFSGCSEPIGEDRSTYPTMLPLVVDEALFLQFPEVVADCIQRSSHPGCKLLGGQHFRAFELLQDRSPEPSVTERGGVLSLR
jgi:hypothetical protein